jgi:hypothetical protein
MVTDISVGFWHTCAKDQSGLRCWGAGTSDNNSWPRFGQATLPLDLESVSEISVGDTHACAIDDKGVICWGEGEDGDNYSSYNYDQGIVPDYLRE